jgi:hypothetical protein
MVQKIVEKYKFETKKTLKKREEQNLSKQLKCGNKISHQIF